MSDEDPIIQLADGVIGAHEVAMAARYLTTLYDRVIAHLYPDPSLAN